MNVPRFFLSFLPFFLCAAVQAGAPDYAKFVDPMIGTDDTGHVFPGATAPFGMVQVSPDTGTRSWERCSGYHYRDKGIVGFSHNHLSGTGCGDLGCILFLPVVGAIPWEPVPAPAVPSLPSDVCRVRFDHADEHAEAGYYRVIIKDSGVAAELTATERAAVHRYTFPKAGDAAVLIDLNHKLHARDGERFEGSLKIENARTVSGWQHSNGWAGNKDFYFVAEFSELITSSEFQVGGKPTSGSSVSGKKVLGALHFNVNPQRPLVVKIGISATDVEGARKNLRAEIAGKDFDAVRKETYGKWNTLLSRMAVESQDPSSLRTFYTSAYHTLLAPNIYNDVDGRYRGSDHKVHENPGFTNFSTFSFWDIFRATLPLDTLIAPEYSSAFAQSMLAFAQHSSHHRLPIWPLCSDDTGTMTGYHAVPFVVDAYFKGLNLGGFKPAEILAAMKQSSNQSEGHELYSRAGYAPSGFSGAQGVSRTLDYAYDDWCISRFAAVTGATEDAKAYAQRATNYRNLYDPSVGFMRGKTREGNWVEKFDPRRVDFDCYTEANAWQSNWAVMHDLPGLIALNGGPAAFIEKLDQMWTINGVKDAPPDVTGLIGQYAHGNEPCHHIAYLYVYAGEPWKTQQWAREIMDTMYNDKLDGICGNDDCGQMSAWYIFSALGFYPVNPASGVYIIGSPRFSKAALTVGPKGQEKRLLIEADNVSSANRYIQSATFNGKPLNRAWITQKELAAGGVIHFTMDSTPNKTWGANALPPETGY